MAHPNLPQFGDWNTAGNVPYTQCFDNIRKGKKERKILNPNDPQENPEAFQDDNIRWNQDPPRDPPRPQFHDDNKRANPTPPRTPQHDHPTRGQFAPPVRPQFAPEPRQRQNPNDNPQRVDLKSEGNASPLRPKFQLPPGKDANSAVPPRTPGRSTMGPAGAGGGRKAAIPEFGGWANNPSEPVGYTMIFTKARDDRREEKQAPTPQIPIPPRTPEHQYNQGDMNKSSKSWFSSFLKKVKGVFTGR